MINRLVEEGTLVPRMLDYLREVLQDCIRHEIKARKGEHAQWYWTPDEPGDNLMYKVVALCEDPHEFIAVTPIDKEYGFSPNGEPRFYVVFKDMATLVKITEFPVVEEIIHANLDAFHRWLHQPRKDQLDAEVKAKKTRKTNKKTASLQSAAARLAEIKKNRKRTKKAKKVRRKT